MTGVWHLVLSDADQKSQPITDMRLEMRRLLLLLASRVAAAPASPIAHEPAVVTLCDESVAISQWLIACGHHQTTEEVIQAALERLMMADRN
jgi:hypothetical protein